MWGFGCIVSEMSIFQVIPAFCQGVPLFKNQSAMSKVTEVFPVLHESPKGWSPRGAAMWPQSTALLSAGNILHEWAELKSLHPISCTVKRGNHYSMLLHIG